jgi:hypothetical protein
MSKPDDLSLKASLAWDYYKFNNGCWCCVESGCGEIIVTDEARCLNDALVLPDYVSFVEWLEADADQKLADDPAGYLRACGVVPGNLLSDAVVEALLATINDPANAPDKPDAFPVSAAEKPSELHVAPPATDASDDEDDLRDYHVTFSVVGTVDLTVEANDAEDAKYQAKLDFDEINFGEYLEISDYNILTIEDENGKNVYVF